MSMSVWHLYSYHLRCYPIGKVFVILRRISIGAANKLLDARLVEDVLNQIVALRREHDLKVYHVSNGQGNFLSRLWNPRGIIKCVSGRCRQ